jgi:hypothetical protein
MSDILTGIRGHTAQRPLQRRPDADQSHLLSSALEVVERRQETAGAGAIEEHHHLEIDAEAGVPSREGGADVAAEFRPARVVEVALG